MGITDKLPKKERLALVIASMITTMCHKCDGCKKERHLFCTLSVPNDETERCRDCIDVQYKLKYGEETNGIDG